MAVITQFHRDTHLLIGSLGIFAISFFGIQSLIRTLYLLRLDFSLTYIGVLSGVGAFAYMSLSLPSGALGTRFGARRTMLVGGSITVFGMLMLPAIEFLPLPVQYSWPIISNIVLTIGWALFSVNHVPTLMAKTTSRNRNGAYALNSTFRGLGTFIGTVTGGFLPGLFVFLFNQSLDDPAPYQLSLVVGALLALIALIPLCWIGRLRETDSASSPEELPADQAFPLILMFMVMGFIFLSQGSSAACQSFCSAFMDTELKLPASTIGLITGAGQFVAIFAPLLAPRLVGRYGHVRLLTLIPWVAAFSLIPLIFVPHWATVGWGRLGTLIASAVWFPTIQVFQMELVNARWRSMAYAFVSMAGGLSFSVVSFAGGYLADTYGYVSLFILGIGMSTLGGLVMWLMRRKQVAGIL